MTRTTTEPDNKEKEEDITALTANFSADEKNARIKAVSDPKIIDPLVFKNPLDRQAATFTRAQRIVEDKRFQALPDEHKVKVLGNYYDKYVTKAYNGAGLKAPDKDLWIRTMPQLMGKNSSTDAASFYVGRNAREVAETSAAFIKGTGNVLKGMSYAGIGLSRMATRATLGLSSYFGAAPKTIANAQATSDARLAEAKATVDQVSHNIFDQADFWLQTHPSKNWQDHVDTFIGENLVQLPLYEAIGSARVGTIAHVVGEDGKLASLTAKLAESKKGMWVARRLGEASDAYLGATFQNSKSGERISDMIAFMTLGTGSEAAAKAVMYPTKAAVKKLTASNLAVGGTEFQHTIVDEAEHELDKHLHMTVDEVQKYTEDDPVKAHAVTAEKVTLTAMGRQKYGKPWNQLSHSQRNFIRAQRDDITREAVAELPLHAPDIAKGNAQKILNQDAAQNPKLAQRIQEFEKNFGFKVVDALQSTEKNKIELQTGVKNSQDVIGKLGKNAPIKLDPVRAIAREEEPKKFAQLKMDTLAYFKNPYSKAGVKETPQILAARLRDMDSEEFVQDIKDEMGAGKYKFENSDHALLWANHFRSELPKPFANRLVQELHDRYPTQTIKDWDKASNNLERHMDYLATTGRLFDQKNIFRSTKVSYWLDKTKWQKQLLDEVEDTEFEKTMNSLKSYPELQRSGRTLLKQLQKARRLSSNPDEDRALTEAIRKIDAKDLGKGKKKGAKI